MGVISPGVCALRVGLVIYGSLDTLSGGFLYDRKLVEHLREAGDHVEIISLPWRNYGLHLTDAFSRSLRRQLEAADVDVMLQDELNHPSLFRVNRAVRGQWPIISIVHHLRSSEKRAAWKNRAYRAIERRYLATVDGFIFNSQTTRDAVHSLVGDTRPNVVAFPAGDRLQSDVTEARIAARANEPGPLRILFLGNVIERKELHVLLDAVSLAREANCRVDVVGGLDVEPAYTRRVMAQTGRLDLGARVAFHGPLMDDHLKRQLAAAHVLAVPSSYEGYGIVYLEAMAFGAPAIATTSGAAHEIITDGVDGFLMPPGDATQLAAHLTKLAANRDRLAEMGIAGLHRFRRHSTWTASTSAIREFLTDVVGDLNA